MPHFVGLDWASRSHAVCVIDERGGIVARFEVTHDNAGLTQLRERLKRIDAPTVAIERPEGVLVDTLLDANVEVIAIHPNIMKAVRSRYRIAGKSDVGDAYILADLLRTDGHRFKPLVPHADEIKALRVLVRLRKDLVRTRVGLANQLRALLQAVFPGAACLFADVDSAIALAFLQAFPSEAATAKLSEKRMQRFLAVNAYSGRRSAGELLARLRSAPRPIIGDDLSGTAAEGVLSLVAVLEPLIGRIASLTTKIEHRLREFTDGKIVQSFPGSGSVTAAMILAELGSDRERFQTAEQFAAIAGVTPVTYASGKRRGVGFRWACNHDLREALTCLANNSRHRSPWARDMYQRARARGCDHPHATRVLARAWARVLWRCWRDRTSYDPARHAQAARFAA